MSDDRLDVLDLASVSTQSSRSGEFMTTMNHAGWPGALIVDDVPTTLQIGIQAMRMAGFRTMGAQDGLEAVELIGRDQFDVVLMDINMPRMTGLEATDVIRDGELQTCRHLPIVFVTAETAYADETVFRAAGADAYLPKPFHFDQLIQVLNELKIGRP